MSENNQQDLRKRKQSGDSGQNSQRSKQQALPLTHIPTPQFANQRVPFSDLLTPPSSRRVSLSELLTCKFLCIFQKITCMI